jgi:isocitrate/isopropylmalate dehydrogenase
MAMMFTAKLMLDWLGEKEAGTRLENALAAVIAEGKIGTYDVKGRGNGDSTMDVAEEVARKVSETVNA